LKSNGELISIIYNKCLEISNSDTSIGTPVTTWTCNGNRSQQWYYNETDSTIRTLSADNMCLDAGRSLSCQSPQLNTYAYCNYTLPINERLDDLIKRMTLVDQMAQMISTAPPINSLGIPAYQWSTECLHGVLSSCGVNCPTSFPAPSALVGSTFNMTLIRLMAKAISDEGRALNNEAITGLDYWAPNININRDPRWGRGQETPGEDPYLTSQYVMNFVKGLQEGTDPH